MADEDDHEDFEDHPATEVRPAAPAAAEPAVPDGEAEDDEGGEDLLAGSLDFMEESDDEEDLWFEKGPPQDFDFEDK